MMSVAARVAGGLAILLAGCAGETGVALSGGQTPVQLAEDRARCVPFVQAHPETTPGLAEAACLVARGYRAPLPLAQGTAPIGSLYATARGEATSIVRDFETCNLEAFKTPMPEIRDEKSSGIFSNLIGGFFPRGVFVKALTADDWAMKSFAACLSRRGYAVSEVRTGR